MVYHVYIIHISLSYFLVQLALLSPIFGQSHFAHCRQCRYSLEIVKLWAFLASWTAPRQSWISWDSSKQWVTLVTFITFHAELQAPVPLAEELTFSLANLCVVHLPEPDLLRKPSPAWSWRPATPMPVVETQTITNLQSENIRKCVKPESLCKCVENDSKALVFLLRPRTCRPRNVFAAPPVLQRRLKWTECSWMLTENAGKFMPWDSLRHQMSKDYQRWSSTVKDPNFNCNPCPHWPVLAKLLHKHLAVGGQPLVIVLGMHTGRCCCTNPLVFLLCRVRENSSAYNILQRVKTSSNRNTIYIYIGRKVYIHLTSWWEVMLRCSQQHHMTRLFSHQRVLFYFPHHLFVRLFGFIHCILTLWAWNGGKFSRAFFAIEFSTPGIQRVAKSATSPKTFQAGSMFQMHSRGPAPMPIWPKPCPGMWSLTPGPKRYFFPWQVAGWTNKPPKK